jgi:hypothetical protein
MNAQMFENLALLASSDPRFEKYSLNLNQDELDFIKKLLENNPEFFEAISKELSAIMEDGKINLSDVPNIVLIVSKASKLNFKKMIETEGYPNVNTLHVIKYIVCYILESGFVPLPEVQIKLIVSVVNNSCDLLEHIPFETIKENVKQNSFIKAFNDLWEYIRSFFA